MKITNNKKVVIVLPTYNERDNIRNFIDFLLETIYKIEKKAPFLIEVLVVDDNSPDGTANEVEKYFKQNPKVSLINNNSRGLGNAYIKGFMYAMQNMFPDILMQMDADFSHNPEDIIKILNPLLDKYDFVIGSRYIPGGSIPKNWHFIRKLLSKYGNIICRKVLGLNIGDCTSGLRGIKTSVLKNINLENFKTNGYAFQIKLLFEANKIDARIFEIPICFKDREFGDSKLGILEIIKSFVQIFKMRLLNN